MRKVLLVLLVIAVVLLVTAECRRHPKRGGKKPGGGKGKGGKVTRPNKKGKPNDNDKVLITRKHFHCTIQNM